MPQVIMEMNTALNSSHVSCTLSTNCTQIRCQNIAARDVSFMIEIQFCKNPQTVRIARLNGMTGKVTYESIIYKSQMIGLDLGYGFVTLNVTLAPHSTRLSLGLEVSAMHVAYCL